MNQEIVLTPSGLLSFLSSMEELEGKDIGIGSTDDNNGLVVYVGDNVYQIESDPSSDVVVPSDVVDELTEINEDGYDELDASIEEDYDQVEGGIVKELIKTLAIGGLVRLTADTIKNS